MKRSRVSRRLWPSMHSKCSAYGWVFTGRKSCAWTSVAHCGSLLTWCAMAGEAAQESSAL